MNEKSQIENSTVTPKIISPEAKKLSEHLDLSIEGAKPITVSIGSFEDFKKLETEHPEHPNINNNFALDDLKNIDWDHGTYDSKNREDFLTGGPETYVISSIDSSNKFSQKFESCTGFIVAGIDNKTGANISFVTHQPRFFFSSSFMRDFKKRLFEMQERCKSGTIDAVLIGGLYPESPEHMRDTYIQTVESFSKKVQKTFGFEPVVINGPKTSAGEGKYDDIYYDNNNRRLYFVRPEVNANVNAFPAGEVEKYKDEFKPKS